MTPFHAEPEIAAPGPGDGGRCRFSAALVFLFGGAGLVACASSSIPRLSEEPRVQRVPGTGRYVWDESRGWIQPSRGSWGPAEHTRAEARRAFEAGAYADALAGFLVLQEALEEEGRGGPSPEPKGEKKGSDLSFFIAECYYHLGNYEEALPYYRNVYRRDFPGQEVVNQAFRRVYEIGMAYLQEKVPCEFLGIRYSCPEYGIEILADPKEGLLEEFPFLSFADEAKIEIARYYFESKQYPEAVPIYDSVAARLESEWSGTAEYQAALAVFLEVRGVDYDEAKLQEAHRRFTRYLENHPRGAYMEEAREKLREISEMEGEKNLRIAKFYLRESKIQSCEIYLRRVRERYPNSTAAREAREIQRQLDQEGRRW